MLAFMAEHTHNSKKPGLLVSLTPPLPFALASGATSGESGLSWWVVRHWNVCSDVSTLTVMISYVYLCRRVVEWIMVEHHDGETVRNFSDHGFPWSCLHGIFVLVCLLENISLNNREMDRLRPRILRVQSCFYFIP